MTLAVAQVFAARQPLELETSYGKAKRIILRDVLRTDRNFHYFRSAPRDWSPLPCSPTH